MYRKPNKYHRTRKRSLGFEAMEQRALLSADGIVGAIDGPVGAGEPGDAVTIRLEVVDDTGDSVTSIEVGQPFLLNVYAEDTRETTSNRGIFAMYLDISYDASLADVIGPLTFAADFANGRLGATDTDGAIDNAGAFTRLASPRASEALIFSAPMLAEAEGELQIVTGPAGASPITDVLFFDERAVVEPEDIFYATTSIDVISSASPGVQVTMLDTGVLDSLNELALQFSEDISEVTTLEDLVQLTNISDGTSIDTTDVPVYWDSESLTARWDLSSEAATPGMYVVTVFGTRFSDGLALDGNGDGTVGDDFLASFVVTWPGDVDNDLDVDFADFLAFSGLFGSTDGTATEADFDGDGSVGFSDFLLLSSNFGKSL